MPNAPYSNRCTETYLVIGPFKKKQSTINIINYMQTKFFYKTSPNPGQMKNYTKNMV